MLFGWMCRRPGPSLSVFLLPFAIGVGSAPAGMSSPGRTSVVETVAMEASEDDCSANRTTDEGVRMYCVNLQDMLNAKVGVSRITRTPSEQ